MDTGTRFFESIEIKDIAAALAKAQGEFPAITKDHQADVQTKEGRSYKYNYADLGDVLDAIRPILSKNEIAITQPTLFNNKGQFVLLTRLIHSSGQWMACEWALPGQATPQQMGSALTYGRRYSLQTLCGVAPEQDDDGGAASDTKPDRPQRRPTASAARPTQTPHNPVTGEVEDDSVPDGDTTLGPYFIEPTINERGGISWAHWIEEFQRRVVEMASLHDLVALQTDNMMTLKRLRGLSDKGYRAHDALLEAVATRRAQLVAALPPGGDNTVLAAG